MGFFLVCGSSRIFKPKLRFSFWVFCFVLFFSSSLFYFSFSWSRRRRRISILFSKPKTKKYILCGMWMIQTVNGISRTIQFTQFDTNVSINWQLFAVKCLLKTTNFRFVSFRFRFQLLIRNACELHFTPQTREVDEAFTLRFNRNENKQIPFTSDYFIQSNIHFNSGQTTSHTA